ncbi:hypothetical protein ES705_12007 [subsurface metagenome]
MGNKADGKLGLALTSCVICGKAYFGGRQFTCSDACHEELANRLIAKYGEFKKVVRDSTGEAFKVPTRDIIEKGVQEQDLDQYPKWGD